MCPRAACHGEHLCPGVGEEGPRGPWWWVAGPGARCVGSLGPHRRLTLLPLLPSAEMETNNHFNFTGLSSAPAASGPKPTPASGDSPFAHGSPLSFPPQGKSKCPHGAGAAQPGQPRGAVAVQPAAAPRTWGCGQGSVVCPPSPWPRKAAVPEWGLCVDLAGQLIQRSPAKHLANPRHPAALGPMPAKPHGGAGFAERGAAPGALGGATAQLCPGTGCGCAGLWGHRQSWGLNGCRGGLSICPQTLSSAAGQVCVREGVEKCPHGATDRLSLLWLLHRSERGHECQWLLYCISPQYFRDLHPQLAARRHAAPPHLRLPLGLRAVPARRRPQGRLPHHPPALRPWTVPAQRRRRGVAADVPGTRH